jgi:RNA polymerase sigma-70 factor (ECF subfamily)
MHSTSQSLLDRLQAPEAAEADWERLQQLYLPLIHFWLSRVPGLSDESGDLAQDVLLVLIREMPTFRRQRDGSFRAWLRGITLNRIRDYRRKRRRRPQVVGDATDGYLARLADPHSELSRQWDRDHDEHVLRELLALVRVDFTPVIWEAFTRFALQGQSGSVVAVELGLTERAVVQAKYRVLKRLREEGGALLE